ncbi:hypothetical protein LshimejAT787_1402720 [Lyophyllum shimeji]|uniref:Uncharacterized protein n=1 Tax=Lyophyllum shimeji TaxID=47721 RepID=A0A9P3PXD5_LYOSH|nr:hypothetical protein LshimejAT787_1402720 [Lyophyllum shimeji]
MYCCRKAMKHLGIHSWQFDPLCLLADDQEMDEERIDHLKECLEARHKAGDTLTKLTITRCDGLRNEMIEDLKKIVQNVDWDGSTRWREDDCAFPHVPRRAECSLIVYHCTYRYTGYRTVHLQQLPKPYLRRGLRFHVNASS